jgi:hypothetical protein
LCSILLTPQAPHGRIHANNSVGPPKGASAAPAVRGTVKLVATEGAHMQYLPGFTVQCINPMCEARGHWLRADATGPIAADGRCPCCGDFLRNVPPPLSPRFRMRPRPLTARPPLRPR